MSAKPDWTNSWIDPAANFSPLIHRQSLLLQTTLSAPGRACGQRRISSVVLRDIKLSHMGNGTNGVFSRRPSRVCPYGVAAILEYTQSLTHLYRILCNLTLIFSQSSLTHLFSQEISPNLIHAKAIGLDPIIALLPGRHSCFNSLRDRF